MATRRLFWKDPYRTAFDANVLACRPLGEHFAVILDATCFYATSGGQPHDTGALSGVPVLDVLEQEGELLHVLAEPVSPGPAHGVVAWPRRFDHMQQHTGQHILSQALLEVAVAPTVSFHLGEAACTIDIAAGELTAEQAARAEELANEVVLDNRPVRVGEYTAEQAAGLALRRVPELEGPLRIVEVADFDRCACGGTHVRATGELGAIHISRWERRRGTVRVEFLVGWRALRDYRLRDALLRGMAQALTVGAEELPAAMARFQESERAAQRQIEALRARLLEAEGARLAQTAEPVGPWRVVSGVLADCDAAGMRVLAQGLIQQPGLVALLAVTEPAVQLCFARAQDVALDMGALLRAVMAPLGGRGGGQPHFAQGGGLRAEDLVSVLAQARARLLAR